LSAGQTIGELNTKEFDLNNLQMYDNHLEKVSNSSDLGDNQNNN